MSDAEKYIPTCSDRPSLMGLLQRQKLAQIGSGTPSIEVRCDRIDRAVHLLVENKDRLTDALCQDFGQRSIHTSLLTDVAASIASLKYARDKLRSWTNPDRRMVSPRLLGLFGARASVIHQPKGVVGIMSPWNYPVNLVFSPLAGALAAGCRAMIKPSEITPRTSQLVADLIRSHFDESEIAVVLGGPEVGATFASLPFDHLLFTGAGAVARQVALAAAENLVPTTLELGGKSPVVVGRSANFELAAARVMMGKSVNAGQTCLAPDFAILPEDRLTEFVHHAKCAVASMYPTIQENPDYTSVITPRHWERLQGYLQDARSKGAEVVELNPGGEDFSQQRPNRKIPPTLVLNPTDDMLVMQEEIFGPILPLATYKSIEDAIHMVNSRPRPLALYYFGRDGSEEQRVLSRTTSGGVTVNDVIMHVAMDDLPFGGIGPSGMGAYHGEEGFKTFSHAKAVYRQSRFDITSPLRPPYGAGFARIVGSLIRR